MNTFVFLLFWAWIILCIVICVVIAFALAFCGVLFLIAYFKGWLSEYPGITPKRILAKLLEQ